MQIVLTTSLKDILTESGQGYSLCKGGIFKHALGTAVMSSRLAELSRRVPAHLAYTAGLLHDIGKVVLDQWMASTYPLFYRKIRYEGASLLEVERELFGMDHCEAGERLAEHWGLPETIREVMKCHHMPCHATQRPELVHTVHIADLVMSRFMAELRGCKYEESSLSHSLSALGFGTEQLLPLLDFLVNSAIAYPLL
jgi:putative nucleotidyltransferase with HDIG domain